jgi:hypothetical protein
MLAPPKVHAPESELDVSRLSIYAGQHGGLTEFRKTFPSVWTTAWRAPDGSVALAVASISEEPVTPALEVDPAACGLAPRGRVYRIDPDGRRRLGEYGGRPLILRPALAPGDACLLELHR